jgi:hypothetical protein
MSGTRKSPLQTAATTGTAALIGRVVHNAPIAATVDSEATGRSTCDEVAGSIARPRETAGCRTSGMRNDFHSAG